MSKRKGWIQRLKEKRAQYDPANMTEEQRIQHELYVKEMTKKNVKSAKILGAVLWCVMMAAWSFLIVLDVKHEVGTIKILFHSVAAAVTALFALPTVIDFFSRKKKDDEDTEA